MNEKPLPVLEQERIEALAGDPDAFVPPRHREIEGKVMVWPPYLPGATNGPPPTIFYKPGELLTTVKFEDEVRILLAELGVLEGEIDERQAPGVVTFLVTGDSLAVARQVKQRIPAAPVGPHHVMALAPQPSIGPGGDPRPTAELPATGVAAANPPAPIAVIDTGMWMEPRPRPELAKTVDPASDNVEVVDAQRDSIVDHRGSGHGGFITGVILSRLPNADVHNYDAFEPNAELTEISIVQRVDQALADHDIVVLNMSLGSYEDKTCGGTELVALRRGIARWARQNSDGILVAAAGNDSVSVPWYPAGFAAEYPDFVVSVGALDAWRREDKPGARTRAAMFSNYGSWVTAWAPGVDVVSDYPQGLHFVYFAPGGGPVGTGRFDDGRAKWDGTSFAAPYAAAEIARYAADHGLTPRQAWATIRGGRPFVVFGG